MMTLLWLFPLTLLAGGVLAFVFGPREAADLKKVKTAFDFTGGVDAYLQRVESARDDIKPGLHKHMRWADPATKAKTPYSLVYIHGFSASLEEVRPLPDRIAQALGANLYFTRLSGHGLVQTETSTGMGQALVHDWLNDAAEALAVGRETGRRVVVLSASTGSTLLTWVLAQPEHRRGVVANIMISPNFGIVSRVRYFLTLPWAVRILPKILGPRRIWKPRSAEEAKFWTYNYPFEALVRMAAAVRLANRQNFEAMSVATLFVYSALDRVVRAERTRKIAQRWGRGAGTPVKTEAVSDSGDPNHHVIAGAHKSPGTTERLAQAVVGFVRETSGQPKKTGPVQPRQ